MNPYKILGVTDQATDEEVKRAYIAMAAKYHPDAGGDAWVFAQVREAYDHIIQLRGSAKNEANKAASENPRASKSNPYTTPQPTAYSSYANPSASAEKQVLSLKERLFTLLFRHQLPLQSETNYFILVNVLDIVFTNVLLRMHAMEANPIANQILIHWGFPGMIAFKLFLVACVCLITQLIAVHHLQRARQTLYLGTVIVGAVVGYSAFLLARSH